MPHNLRQTDKGSFVLEEAGGNKALHTRAGLSEYVSVRQDFTIARTNTGTSGDIHTFPAGAIIDDMIVYGTTGSNAGTTGSILLTLCGSSGNTADGTTGYFLTYDIKNGGAGIFHPTSGQNLTAFSGSASDFLVSGQYSESGASTAGGPWRVSVLYHRT